MVRQKAPFYVSINEEVELKAILLTSMMTPLSSRLCFLAVITK